MIRQYIKLFLESDSSNEEKKKEKSFAEMLDDYIASQNKNLPKETPAKNDPGNILNPDDVGFYRRIKKKD